MMETTAQKDIFACPHYCERFDFIFVGIKFTKICFSLLIKASVTP